MSRILDIDSRTARIDGIGRGSGATSKSLTDADADIEKMADEAERGYDVAELVKRRRGRPMIGTVGIIAIDTASFFAIQDLPWSGVSPVEGRDALERGEVAVPKVFADRTGLSIGDKIILPAVDGATRSVRVGGLYRTPEPGIRLIVAEPVAAAISSALASRWPSSDGDPRWPADHHHGGPGGDHRGPDRTELQPAPPWSWRHWRRSARPAGRPASTQSPRCASTEQAPRTRPTPPYCRLASSLRGGS